MGYKPVERNEKGHKTEQTMKKNFLRRIHNYDSYEIFVKLNEFWRENESFGTFVNVVLKKFWTEE